MTAAMALGSLVLVGWLGVRVRRSWDLGERRLGAFIDATRPRKRWENVMRKAAGR
jgi:hypothetical protein